ncbi:MULTISPECIES: cytochrome P450 [unclassified Pseudonocardia]|uniref:cytochrome P450 n=1 Tax=unclassified Pseudonocardia TaxID=2619320 RepID=UPI0001FFEEE0|nr:MULTISPECIES: cytochrome P450 [unclassified Pseudonocardia]ALL77727.1 cytochrome P450 [Pseudonocardia sp. EC080610-09]ALL80643.1 cytochrome P450 [Pseudonocardia sp. EC080619-01]OLM17449.1 putative cytochrome P450 hydroxylase [Pseudonocardia sp. Ae707_Ps1]
MAPGDSTAPTESATAMRSLVPEDLLERSPRCPFDPAPGLAARRGGGAVQTVDLRNGARAFLVTGFEEARQVLADPRFSSDRVRYSDATALQPHEVAELAAAAARGEPVRPADVDRNDGMFIFMDPPEHTRIRRLLQGQFTVRRMRALETRMTEIAATHIDAMIADGPGADLVPAYALPLPSQMICELLGVDYADRATFQENTSVGLNANSSDAERARALGELYAFLTGLITHKREHPGDDLLSGLVHDADPPLPDNQLVDIALVLLGAGHETTANMLALGTYALLQHPEQQEFLRTHPDRIDDAVEELLRYLSIIQLGVTRIATETVTVGDTEVPAGATVIIGIPEVNRDGRQVDAADALDVSRGRVGHLAFGHGVHQCIGSQLARVEMKVGFTELFARLPGLRLAVTPDEVPLRNEMLIFGVHSLPVTWG